MRETVRELGEFRANGFLNKFYWWYLGRGRFPKPFKQELVMLPTLADVETRLLACAPGAADVLERLEADLGDVDEVLLDSLPISIYGGGSAASATFASSGSGTTLSCSLASVRAPMAVALSVSLRLNGWCGMSAGM